MLKPNSTKDRAKLSSPSTGKRNFSQDHASTVTEQTEDLVFIHIHLIGALRGTSHRTMPSQLLNRSTEDLVGALGGTFHRIMPAQLLNRQRISSSSTSHRSSRRNFSQDHASAVTEQTEDLVFIHINLDGALGGTSHRIMPATYWTDRGSRLHPHKYRWSSRRNFSQDHTSAVTEQTEDLVFIHIHLVGALWGTSHRIMPAQLLNRQRISSSSTYISTEI